MEGVTGVSIRVKGTDLGRKSGIVSAPFVRVV